jgi:hypothetical protein
MVRALDGFVGAIEGGTELHSARTSSFYTEIKLSHPKTLRLSTIAKSWEAICSRLFEIERRSEHGFSLNLK